MHQCGHLCRLQPQRQALLGHPIAAVRRHGALEERNVVPQCLHGRQLHGYVPPGGDAVQRKHAADLRGRQAKFKDGTACPSLCVLNGTCGICQPKSKRCSGKVPQTCNDAGQVWTSAAACTYVCDNTNGDTIGVCSPGDTRCNGSVPRRAIPAVSGSKVQLPAPRSASTNQFARTAHRVRFNASGNSRSFAIRPATGGMLERRAEHLPSRSVHRGMFTGQQKSSATGNISLTCGNDGQMAHDGNPMHSLQQVVCSDCSPGAKTCIDKQPRLCDNTGAWGNNGAACSVACVAGACTACAPNAVTCLTDHKTLQTCNALGVPTTMTCPNACIGAACGGTCSPGTLSCKADNKTVQTCTDTGTLIDTTTCMNACVGGVCKGTCSPGATSCVDNKTIQTCNNMGTFANPTPCPFACVGNVCGGMCSPGDATCLDNKTLQTCDNTGTNQTTTCTNVCSGNKCAGTCSPGDTRCVDANTKQTCAADEILGHVDGLPQPGMRGESLHRGVLARRTRCRTAPTCKRAPAREPGAPALRACSCARAKRVAASALPTIRNAQTAPTCRPALRRAAGAPRPRACMFVPAKIAAECARRPPNFVRTVPT